MPDPGLVSSYLSYNRNFLLTLDFGELNRLSTSAISARRALIMERISCSSQLYRDRLERLASLEIASNALLVLLSASSRNFACFSSVVFNLCTRFQKYLMNTMATMFDLCKVRGQILRNISTIYACSQHFWSAKKMFQSAYFT